MKLISEYTKDELTKLKTKAIEKIVKLHLANEGIAIPRDPIEPEYENIPEKDKKLFSIAGIGGVYFEKREIAEEIIKLFKNNFSQLRDIKSDYFNGASHARIVPFEVNSYSYQPPSVNDIKLIETMVYSNALYTQIKAKLEANGKLKENYDKKKEVFDKAEEAARSTIDMIWETVREAQREQEIKDDKLSTYKEYLALADGDKDIAWKFMKKAHTVTQEQEDYISANI